MLPYPEDVKAKPAESPAIPVVPPDVGLDLGSPEYPVGLRELEVLFASVPEAPVDEDDEIDEGDQEVRLPGKAGMFDVGNPVREEPVLEREFRRRILALYPGHYPTSLLLGDPVHGGDVVVFRDERQGEIEGRRQ